MQSWRVQPGEWCSKDMHTPQVLHSWRALTTPCGCLQLEERLKAFSAENALLGRTLRTAQVSALLTPGTSNGTAAPKGARLCSAWLTASSHPDMLLVHAGHADCDSNKLTTSSVIA